MPYAAARRGQPRAPRLGELRLGLLQAGAEAVRRQMRHDHRARDRPLPRMIWRYASARLGYSTDVAPAAVDHVVIGRSPGAGNALARVAKGERPAERLAYFFFNHDAGRVLRYSRSALCSF